MVKQQKSNRFDKSLNISIVKETPNHSKQSQKIIESHIEVPCSSPYYPQFPYTPTAYDYLALAPSLLVAATPLILRWFDCRNKNEDKEN